MSAGWWGEDIVPRIRFRIPLSRRLIVEHDKPGEVIPDGYGVAYLVPGSDRAILMPMPLNFIASAARALFLRLRFPPWLDYDAQIREAERRAAVRVGNEALFWIVAHVSRVDAEEHLRKMILREMGR